MGSVAPDIAKALAGVFSGGTVSIIAGCVLLVLVGIGAFILGRKMQKAKVEAAHNQSNQQASNDQTNVISQNQQNAQGNQSTVEVVESDKEKAKQSLKSG